MTQDIVRIEGTASDTLTQGSREQCALLSLGKKVTSVNSNLHPPWALKKKKVKSWPLSCICACVTRMPFCVKARLIHVINRIHSQKTHCMRVHKFLHKFCIVIISLYRHRAMRTATKTGKSGFTMSLARLSGQKGWSSCSSASYQQKPQISQ